MFLICFGTKSMASVQLPFCSLSLYDAPKGVMQKMVNLHLLWTPLVCFDVITCCNKCTQFSSVWSSLELKLLRFCCGHLGVTKSAHKGPEFNAVWCFSSKELTKPANYPPSRIKCLYTGKSPNITGILLAAQFERGSHFWILSGGKTLNRPSEKWSWNRYQVD